MKLVLMAVTGRTKSKQAATDDLITEYVKRASRYEPCESVVVASEAEVLAAAASRPGRPAGHLILLDSQGDLLTSEEFAAYLGIRRDSGVQRLLLAVGPADGWSTQARKQAQKLFSLGRITLPHELVRVVLAEQTYRALTILARHPYHGGH